jgi:hypothetical protein
MEQGFRKLEDVAKRHDRMASSGFGSTLVPTVNPAVLSCHKNMTNVRVATELHLPRIQAPFWLNQYRKGI